MLGGCLGYAKHSETRHVHPIHSPRWIRSLYVIKPRRTVSDMLSSFVFGLTRAMQFLRGERGLSGRDLDSRRFDRCAPKYALEQTPVQD
jgi:hypothetical protein